MTTATPLPDAVSADRGSARRLARWSLLMLPLWLVVALALGFFGTVVLLPALGLSEGDLLLMAGGVAGWVAEVSMSLLIAAPAIAGVVLAVVALRRGAGWVAWLGLLVNAVVIAQTLFAFIDSVHMTYYPQGGWLFW